ncbi:MAG: BRO family protein [Succinatimonas hippei]|nr:BRO family protein [Succinatimonas hippei]
MANSLSFTFHSSPVRTLANENEIFFCLPDVCHVLELGQSNKTVNQIKTEFSITELNSGMVTRPDGSRVRATFITEPQLYFVMMRSRSKVAREFRQWICNEVLPAIRKTGRYEVVSKPKKVYKSSGAVYVQKASPVVQAPAVPPLMRQMERVIRSDSGSYYEVWELWRRKCGVLGLVPDWASGAETASWLHVFKDSEGKVLFSMLDLCMMCGIDYHDPALSRMVDDAVLVNGKVSELFDMPYTEKFMKLCGAENAVYIVKSARCEFARDISEWLYNTVFPCFGLSANLTRNALLRDYPQLVWAERTAM